MTGTAVALLIVGGLLLWSALAGDALTELLRPYLAGGTRSAQRITA